MKEKAAHLLIYFFAIAIPLAAAISPVLAQSQALNGQIEGSVSDPYKASVQRAVVTVTNIETGMTRAVVTDESGVYRLPLLPLGTYRVTAEAATFMKLVRDGITVATGQVVTLDLELQPGEIVDVVSIAGDSSVADAGRVDLGRVMNSREVQNLPLITRNPYNFAFLQANVTGRPARGFPFTTINANGYLRRVHFLLDGNSNTQGDRGTLRFLIL